MIDHFGILAPIYETFIKPHPPKTLTELIRMPEAGSLLDLGGGTGRVSQYFTAKQTQVVVCDSSFRMLRQSAGKKFLSQVCSHSEGLPFATRSFDRIMMVDALHHVCDQQKTADEMWRVLKPGGRIVIEEPNYLRCSVKLVAWMEKLALMRSNFLNPHEISELFSPYNAFITVNKEGHTGWITIRKPERPSSEFSSIQL